METRHGGRLERAQRRVDIELKGASQRCHAAGLELGCNGANAFEIAVGGDGEAGFDDVHAEKLELAGEAQLLVSIHREARRLLAVAKRGVEDVYRVHTSPPVLVNRSQGRAVKFIVFCLSISRSL